MRSTQDATERRLRKQLAEFTERLSRQVSPFKENTKEAQTKRWRRAKRDTETFGRLYLPHYFTSPSADFHADLDAMVEHAGRHIFAVHGPREHAKSARCRAALIRRLCTGQVSYYLFASEHLKLAKKHVEYVQRELAQNRRIEADFEIDVQKWNETEGVLRARITPQATGVGHLVQLEAISYGTSAKGRLFISRRPDGAFIDDFENTRTAKNERISREKVAWVLQELYPAVTGPVVWVGNTGHDTSALYQAMLRVYAEDDEALRRLQKRGTVPGGPIPAPPPPEAARTPSDGPQAKPAPAPDPGADEGDAEGGEGAPGEAPPEASLMDLSCYSYRAERTLDAGGEPLARTRYLWPERYAPRWYERMRATMGHLYEGEMNGYPVRVGLFFKKEWFEPHYRELPEGVRLSWFSWCDLSFGKSGSNCYRVVVIVATDGHTHYLVDAWARQTDPISDMLDWWYDAFRLYPQLRRGAYENDFGQEDRFRYALQAAEERYGYPLPVRGESNTARKEARIESMQPLASRGKIKFPTPMSADVKVVFSQVLTYPDAPYDDGPDALESGIHRNRLSPAKARPRYDQLSGRRYERGRRSSRR